MLSKKFTSGVLITVISLACIGVILLLLYKFGVINPSKETDISVIQVDVEDGVENPILFDSFEFYPGSERKYKIKMSTEKDGKYELSFKFEELEKTDLKDYIKVKVVDDKDNVLYDELMADALLNEGITVNYSLSKNKSKSLLFIYYMDVSVGNEAKNLELEFNLVVTATLCE